VTAVGKKVCYLRKNDFGLYHILMNKLFYPKRWNKKSLLTIRQTGF
jgi:hypothetical protein